MGKASDWAAECFADGFSCSQAVLASRCESFGMDRETAFRAAGAFGGGMGHSGGACGAVTGALMLIGLKYGKAKKDDASAKDRTYAAVAKYMERFKAKRGSIDCTDLVGYDLSDPAQLSKAREAGVFASVCPLLVRESVEIVEQLLD